MRSENKSTRSIPRGRFKLVTHFQIYLPQKLWVTSITKKALILSRTPSRGLHLQHSRNTQKWTPNPILQRQHVPENCSSQAVASPTQGLPESKICSAIHHIKPDPKSKGLI